MLYSLSSVILAAGLLLAMVLNLSIKPRFSAKLTTACMAAALVGGLLFYGIGFAETTGSVVLSVERTPIAVIRMFMGINELSAIADSSPVSGAVGLVLFWLVHLLAIYSMASAAMITLGAEALRYLRMMLSRRGDLTLIYGVNDNSIELGKGCLGEENGSVVYVAESAAPGVVADLNNLGMSVLTGAAAAAAEESVLRRLRAERRKLNVYALNPEEDKDLVFAVNLRNTLEKLGAEPQNTCITLPGEEEIIAPMLQQSPESYGFGCVYVYKAADLAARAMIRTCPPWDQISFGGDGRAQEDFSCAVVGFGSFGQAALRRLVVNGQFAGGSFHAAVFSPNCESESGLLRTECRELFSQYDIRFYAEDGRSRAFYDYIESRLGTLKLIAVCTGRDEMDREISDDLMLFLRRRGAENVCVVRCGHGGVRYQQSVGSPIIRTGIYTPDLLSAERADRAAILLNDVYDDSERSPWEKWIACDTFGKMSSRASADFLPAFIRISSSSREKILSGEWEPDEKMLEALGETEHLRWNAFHYAMGYTAMSAEEFEANAAAYRAAAAEGKAGNVKIGRNRSARTHACLIPWDELDELSARERAVTGRAVDYRKTDINNVLALPRLLKSMEKDVSGS